MYILGIESSCDESSASVVHWDPSDRNSALLCKSLETHSQIQLHQPYGGVIPELASRDHLEAIIPVIDQALNNAQISPNDLSAVAVTTRPGLMGPLLVGVSVAKTLATIWNKPIIAVDHLEGHLCSAWLDLDPLAPWLEATQRYPMLVLTVSGGHTRLHLLASPPTEWSPDFLKSTCVGRSRDDAAGEAFDKSAKLMGLPYPGGKWIEQHAKNGDPKKYRFPQAMSKKSTLDYSFSGLKTAVSLEVAKIKSEGRLQEELDSLCAAVQEAIVGALTNKLDLALSTWSCKALVVVGGVSANQLLRNQISKLCSKHQIEHLLMPKLRYCTDNGAMIGAAGAFRFHQGHIIVNEERSRLSAEVNIS